MRILHTMLRVGNLDESINFYTNKIGMSLLRKQDYPDGKFTLAFVGFGDEENNAVLELTHNWGAENDDNVKFHDGNSEPKGFGHICFSVPDVYAACKRFEEHKMEFVKKADDGSMKPLAFVKDPDGYWIEIIEAKATANIAKELGKI